MLATELGQRKEQMLTMGHVWIAPLEEKSTIYRKVMTLLVPANPKIKIIELVGKQKNLVQLPVFHGCPSDASESTQDNRLPVSFHHSLASGWSLVQSSDSKHTDSFKGSKQEESRATRLTSVAISRVAPRKTTSHKSSGSSHPEIM